MLNATRRSQVLFDRFSDQLHASGYHSLADIAGQSFSTFRKTIQAGLKPGQLRAIYQAALVDAQLLRAYERKIINRANPQLRNMPALALRSMAKENRDYESLFGRRADAYVADGSVASMFSPAGYLTELYREGRKLHTDVASPRHLDKRRPDFKDLVLSQANLDSEISTLALSNEILRASIGSTNLDQTLAVEFFPIDLPYHAPFSGIEAALSLQDTSFEALSALLEPTLPTDTVDPTTRDAFANHFSPALASKLIQPLPADTASTTAPVSGDVVANGIETGPHRAADVDPLSDLALALIDFYGTNDIAQLAKVDNFCRRAGIDRDELNEYLTLPLFRKSQNAQTDVNLRTDPLVPPSEYGGHYYGQSSSEWLGYANGAIAHVTITAPAKVTSRMHILPSTNENAVRFAAFSVIEDSKPSTHVDIIIDGAHLFISYPGASNDGTAVTLPLINGYREIEFAVTKASYKIRIGVGDANIYSPGGYYPESAPTEDNLTVSFTLPSALELVKLAQVIRYCKKTGLHPATLDTLIRLPNDAAPAISATTLDLSACVLRYMARYHVTEDDAVILVGGNINVYARAGEVSQFDRLFNTPPLDGKNFAINNSYDTLVLDPANEQYAWVRAVLKRALNVDDAGLLKLADIAVAGNLSWARSLANLTRLYRAGLWSKLQGLSPSDLDIVLKLNGTTADIPNQFSSEHRAYFDALSATVQWLAGQKLSVKALDAMTTTAYSPTITPEIERFLETLYQAIETGVPGTSSTARTASRLEPGDARPARDATADAELKRILAPHIAATFGLQGVEAGLALQVWIESIAASRGLGLQTMAAFRDAIVVYYDDDTATTANPAALAAFCQALAQLALIVHTWQLSEAELAIIVYKPRALGAIDALLPTLANLQLISRFKALQLSVGEGRPELLAALDADQLSAGVLARLLNRSVDEVTGAAGYIEAVAPFNADEAARINAWFNVAKQVGVSSGTVHALLSLSLDDTYATWQTVSANVQAGVPESVSGRLTTAMDEALATALTARYLETVGPSLPESLPMKNRDDIYRYLLVDNLVGSDVMTTRIAEAISSIQFYINGCLQGIESEVDSQRLLDTYFVEWDQYNKRYSTWAGVSRLASYPENYIEPTLRYNQTRLQRNLLAEISQSQLSADSVNAAYLNYLDQFEDVANLKILCGYHHAAEMESGISYFVGRTNTYPYRYFWRSLNHEMVGSDGGYTASAWSEWEEIDAPIKPMNDEVRPVIFNNRLYIGCMSEEVMMEATEDSASPPAQVIKHVFQLSHRKINGNWSPCSSFEISLPPTFAGKIFNVYLSYHPLQNAILLMLYRPNEAVTATTCVGGLIDNTISYQSLSGGDLTTTSSLFSNNLNTTACGNKVIRYINALNYEASVSPSTSLSFTSSDKLFKMTNAGVTATVDNTSLPATLSFAENADFSLVSNETKPTVNHYLKWTYGEGAAMVQHDPVTTLHYTVDGNTVTYYYEVLYTVVDHDLHYIPLFLYGDSTDIYSPTDDPDVFHWTTGKRSFQMHASEPVIQHDTMTMLVFRYISQDDPMVYEQPNCSAVMECRPVGLGQRWAFSFGTSFQPQPIKVGTTTFDDSFTQDILIDAPTINVNIDLIHNIETVFSKTFAIDVEQVDPATLNPSDFHHIVNATNQATYLESSTTKKRTRLNTLFANELISRANSGLDNVLSWETQQLQEPALSSTATVKFTFKEFNPTSDSAATLAIIVQNNNIYQREIFRRSRTRGESLEATCTFEVTNPATGVPLYYDLTINGNVFPRRPIPQDANGRYHAGADTEIDLISIEQVDTAPAEPVPMDFSGANGLYFWELFYYTPMLVAERLMLAENFEEAERWLKYVFSPQGYIEGTAPDAHHVDRQWNSRPLAEDTAWDETQVDNTDPDVVAQADPMHYKVATYMKLLDLLIQRGDAAYRKLERDTLTEAKMWYLTALDLLGDEPDVPLVSDWGDPALTLAASETAPSRALPLLDRLARKAPGLPAPALESGARSQPRAAHAAPDAAPINLTGRTANSLTSVFLPTENDKLTGYWRTLRQRMFNLRHNLTIDGLPMTVPIYATPANPKALQSAAAVGYSGGATLPAQAVALQRFTLMLDSARALVAQLIQYGGTLLGVLERKDAEALNNLMQTQARELMQRGIEQQDSVLTQLQAEHDVLEASASGARARRDSYQRLLDEGVSFTEREAINQRIAAGSLASAGNAMRSAGAFLDLIPNIFGLAGGGMHWGAVEEALSTAMDTSAAALNTAAEYQVTSEQYRRRAQEWTIQRDVAEHEIKVIEAQLASMAIQSQAADMQKAYLELQQTQLSAQIDFMQARFTNDALYSWMRGRLSALFYQFYDLTVGRCLKAQAGYHWETGDTRIFIQPGAWDGNYAGLLCGEALAFNLAQMESAYIDWDKRALEVMRTVSMAQEMATALTTADTTFADYIADVLASGTVAVVSPHTLTRSTDNTALIATIDLNALGIRDDYPASFGNTRRIKQVSVTLPALLGPYQDMQAVLRYDGIADNIHQSCKQTAISYGLNDSGQFQLDFNDSRYLPFEGLPIANANGAAKLTLTFPNAVGTGKQNAALQTLTDIILHVRYTIT